MATTNKGLNQPTAGSTGWNVPLNANADILDKALGSFTTITTTSGIRDLTSDEVQNMCIKSTTSAFTANVTYRIPSGIAGQWVVQNQSATSVFTLTVSNVAGGTSVTVPISTVRSIYSDGTNVVYADTPASGDFVNATVSGTLTLGGGDLTGVATQAEAEAGTNNNHVMTPLRAAQAITALTRDIGWNQTWQNVTSSRAPSTSYQNLTSRPIMVTIDANSSVTGGRDVECSVNNSTWVKVSITNGSAGGYATAAFIVPVNHYYRVNGAATLKVWVELR